MNHSTRIVSFLVLSASSMLALPGCMADVSESDNEGQETTNTASSAKDEAISEASEALIGGPDYGLPGYGPADVGVRGCGVCGGADFGLPGYGPADVAARGYGGYGGYGGADFGLPGYGPADVAARGCGGCGGADFGLPGYGPADVAARGYGYGCGVASYGCGNPCSYYPPNYVASSWYAGVGYSVSGGYVQPGYGALPATYGALTPGYGFYNPRMGYWRPNYGYWRGGLGW